MGERRQRRKVDEDMTKQIPTVATETIKMDKSPIVAFFATVSDRSIGSVGRVDVAGGDVEGARAATVRLIEAWEGAQVATFGGGASVALAAPTPHTEADAAEQAATIAAYEPSLVRTPRERAMRRRQRAAGRAARAEVEARYA